MLRIKIAMFTNAGERVWWHKKKDSCCIDFGVDENDIQKKLWQSFSCIVRLSLSKSLGNLSYAWFRQTQPGNLVPQNKKPRLAPGFHFT